MNNKNVRLITALLFSFFPFLCLADDPPPERPAFDPAALQVLMDEFHKKPDTVGTGQYPALKEMDPSLPDHVIYRPKNLAGLGEQKLGVLAWGNGGCSPDGAGARFH